MTETITPGQALYEKKSWSGCDGSRWSTLPPATREPWELAASLSTELDELRERVGVRGELRDVWVAYDRCDCGEPACYGKCDLSVFTSEQTARQEADIRSKRYGGGYSYQHLDKIRVSTQTSGY